MFNFQPHYFDFLKDTTTKELMKDLFVNEKIERFYG